VFINRTFKNAVARVIWFPGTAEDVNPSLDFFGHSMRTARFDLHGFCLPGRFERSSEAPSSSLDDLVKSTCEVLLTCCPRDVPLIFVGVSAGIALAFECAVYLGAQGFHVQQILGISALSPWVMRNSHSIVGASVGGNVHDLFGTWFDLDGGIKTLTKERFLQSIPIELAEEGS
jgi:hypothetical protein